MRGHWDPTVSWAYSSCRTLSWAPSTFALDNRLTGV